MTTGPRSFKASVTPKAAPGEVLPSTQFFDGTAWPGPEFKVMVKSYTAAAKTLPASGPTRPHPWPRTISYGDPSYQTHPYPKFRARPVTKDEREWIGTPVRFRRWHAHRLTSDTPVAALGESYSSDEEREGTVISKAPVGGLWWVLDLSERKFYAMPAHRLTRRGPGMDALIAAVLTEETGD